MVDSAIPAADGEEKPVVAKVTGSTPAAVKDVPKPDKARMPKPDRTELEGTIVVLQEAADTNQARIEELKRLIEAKRDNRKSINAGSQETRARISELNAAFTAHMVSHRRALVDQIAVLLSTALEKRMFFFPLSSVPLLVVRCESLRQWGWGGTPVFISIVVPFFFASRSSCARRRWLARRVQTPPTSSVPQPTTERSRAKGSGCFFLAAGVWFFSFAVMSPPLMLYDAPSRIICLHWT